MKEKQIEERLDRKTALRVLQDLSKRMSPTLDIFGEASLFISRPNFEVVRKKYLDELPEDKVVLSREELENLKEEIKRLDQERLELQVDNNMLCLQLDNKGKETAEKIFEGLMQSKQCQSIIDVFEDNWFVSNIDIKRIAKQFGVEIKE